MTFKNTETGKKTKSSCFLTSACINYYADQFDDNCEELSVLRCFRDTYVTKEDIEHYYITAPMIVKQIELRKNQKSELYNYIYNEIVVYCVEAIKRAEYEKAYIRYKASVLAL